MLQPDPALVSTGLTVRQYFIATALQGLLANPNVISSRLILHDEETLDKLIKHAVSLSDRAIKAEKGSE